MTDEEEHEEETTEGIWARSTAPQSPYSMGQVGTGMVIFVIGLVITFGIPIVLS